MYNKSAHILAWGLLIAAFVFTFFPTDSQQIIILESPEDFLENNFVATLVEREESVMPLIPPQEDIGEIDVIDIINPIKEIINTSNEPESINSSEPVVEEIVKKIEYVENEYMAVLSSELKKREINLQSIALVRCIFRTQYYKISTQPWGEEIYSLGSGVIISPNGTLLTVRHIIEVSDDLLNDPAGRVWERISCDVALTNAELSEIKSIGSLDDVNNPRFKKAEILFTPPDEKYADAGGFDFALLKLESENDLPYTPLFPHLVRFNEREEMILIGYPGRESVSPQKLERFDSQFQTLTYYSEELCGGEIKPCGLRYAFRRYSYDYKAEFWKSTELGIVTPYFRGGFSGGPAFYKGNLIGIATHGVSGDEAKDGWDKAVILTSWDILEFLKEFSNVSLSESF